MIRQVQPFSDVLARCLRGGMAQHHLHLLDARLQGSSRFCVRQFRSCVSNLETLVVDPFRWARPSIHHSALFVRAVFPNSCYVGKIVVSAVPQKAYRRSGVAKKFINDPQDILMETLEGLVAAYHGSLKLVEGFAALTRREIPEGKVALLIGGGSGHEPLFHGFVGENLADGAACGAFFTSPSPDVILAATRAIHRGNGVLYVYGNYAGDNLNFDIAAELAEDEGITVKTVRIWDDVYSAPLDEIEQRRGISGDIFVVKVAGAAAATLGTLDEVYHVTAKARDNTRSIGVAAEPGTNPVTGNAFFELAEDEIEIGMGVHGEPGVSREKMAPVDELVARLMGDILVDLPFQPDDRVCLLINSLGSTTVTEMLIINRCVREILQAHHIAVHDTQIGHFAGSQEMAGFSISLMKLDDELQRYYDMPCKSLGLTKQ